MHLHPALGSSADAFEFGATAEDRYTSEAEEEGDEERADEEDDHDGDDDGILPSTRTERNGGKTKRRCLVVPRRGLQEDWAVWED